MPPSTPSSRLLAAPVAMALAAGLALVLPATAPAFTWQFPVTPLLAGSDGADSADVAVAPDGTTTIVYVWRSSDISNQASWIRAATRPAGQSDFIYSDVSIPFDSLGYLGSDNSPRIAVSPDGTTTVAWYDGSGDQIWAATRQPGESRFPDPTQTPPQRLSDPTLISNFPDVATADDGSVTVVWDASVWEGGNVNNFGERRTQAATRLPGQARFGNAETLSIPGPVTNSTPLFPQVAAGPAGITTVVWARFDNAGAGTIQAATRRPGQSFPDPAQVPPGNLSSAGESARAPDVAFGADGQTTVVWQGQDQGLTSYTVEAATRQPGASAFGAPQEVGVSPSGEPAAQVAYAPDGQTTVVWGYEEISSSTRAPNSGAWRTPEVLSTGTTNIYPKIAVANDGRATAVWLTGWMTLTAGVSSATRPGGSGNWSSPEALDADAGGSQITPYPNPAIAVAPDGRATVAWTTKTLGPKPAIVTIDSDATRYPLEITTGGTGTGAVISAPSGINCGATCSSPFPLSTPVVLTANASTGSSFSGWGGACSGSATTCTVRILGNASVTATFTKNPPAPAPGPQPSNGFTMTSSAVRGSSIVTRVRVPGAGTMTQRATYSPRRTSSSATRTACTTSRAVRTAGSYTLTCRLNAAARGQRRTSTLRVRLRTTFIPTGGTARSSVRTVVIRPLALPVVG